MRTLALALLASTAVAAAHAQSLTFATIDNPADPTFNQLLGISDAGTISGYFGSGTAVGHPNKGYLIKAPYTTFKPLNLTGSTQTQATGINAAGFVTGFWSDTNLGMGDANFGFIAMPTAKSITFIDVNDPNVASTPHATQVLGINKQNLAVGFYNDANGHSHGFSYDLASATYKAVNIANAMADGATGVNDSGTICGFYVNAKNTTVGFTKNVSGGVVASFKVPGSTNTQLLGINNSGQAVGFFADANNIDHGLLYHPATGAWQQIDDPNGTGGTVLNGLNNKGQAVGFYADAAGNVHGMLVGGIQ